MVGFPPRQLLMAMTDFHWLISAIEDLRYSFVGALCLLIYDWFDNIEDEVEYVHKSEWTSMKVAYLLCRYYPILYWPIMTWSTLTAHPRKTCLDIARYIYGFMLFLNLPAQAVLVFRAYAFSGRNRTVLAGLLLCYVFVFSMHVWLFWVNIPFLLLDIYGHRALSHPGLVDCFPDYRHGALAERVVVNMVSIFTLNFASLLVVAWYCWRSPSRQSSLGKYFMKQGLESFAYNSALSLVALTVYFKGPQQHHGIGLPFIFILPDLLACRLILQLRRLHRSRSSPVHVSRHNSRIVRNALNSYQMRAGTSSHWIIQDRSDS